jgi:glucoamylase
VSWRFNNTCQAIPAGKSLRLELLANATVHWSVDAWGTMQDTPTRATGLDVFIADLPVENLPSGTILVFTFHWSDSDTWEGKDFSVKIVE